MNEKQCKRLRRQVGFHATDWRETVYVEKFPVRFGVTPLCKGAVWTGQAKLEEHCGRAVYHRVKVARQSQLRGKA